MSITVLTLLTMLCVWGPSQANSCMESCSFNNVYVNLDLEDSLIDDAVMTTTEGGSVTLSCTSINSGSCDYKDCACNKDWYIFGPNITRTNILFNSHIPSRLSHLGFNDSRDGNTFTLTISNLQLRDHGALVGCEVQTCNGDIPYFVYSDRVYTILVTPTTEAPPTTTETPPPPTTATPTTTEPPPTTNSEPPLTTTEPPTTTTETTPTDCSCPAPTSPSVSAGSSALSCENGGIVLYLIVGAVSAFLLALLLGCVGCVCCRHTWEASHRGEWGVSKADVHINGVNQGALESAEEEGEGEGEGAGET